MCFAPQRRALFRHLNFQKWSGPGVFCTFWLGNVLRATTACTFSTSQLPKVVRRWCVLYILTWKCASRHNGVHFFDISTSKSGPTLVCFVHFDLEMCFAPQRRALFHLNFQKSGHFDLEMCFRHNGVQFFISHLASFSEPTFRPSGAPNHWKNTVFRDFPTFSRICIFFLLTLSLLLFFLLIFLFSLPLPCSAFHLSITATEKNTRCLMVKLSAGWMKIISWFWSVNHLNVPCCNGQNITTSLFSVTGMMANVWGNYPTVA